MLAHDWIITSDRIEPGSPMHTLAFATKGRVRLGWGENALEVWNDQWKIVDNWNSDVKDSALQFTVPTRCPGAFPCQTGFRLELETV